MSAPERPSRRDGLLTLLRANYAYTFLHQLTFAYAIMTAYFSFNGVNVATIGILIAVWSASTVVFELPSGALSDRFDRRVMLAIAPLFKAACFVVWVLADGSVFLYGLGFALWAFGLVGVATGVGRIVLLLQVDKFKNVSSLGYTAPAAAGAILLIAGLEPNLWMLIPLAGFHLCIAPVEVLTTAGFQKAMDGESRATNTSGASVVVEIVSMLMFVGAGALMDALGILPAYQVGGLCLLIVAVWAFWSERQGQAITG